MVLLTKNYKSCSSGVTNAGGNGKGLPDWKAITDIQELNSCEHEKVDGVKGSPKFSSSVIVQGCSCH